MSTDDSRPDAEVRFYVERAIDNIERGYGALALETEYLRDELRVLAGHLRIVICKMDRDEILRRDRDALYAGMLENVGEPNDGAGV